MYELPGNNTISEVVVTPEAVRGESKPTVVYRAGGKSSKKASA
jgi:ATP-dependent protease Clp ATPase subunit